MFHHHVLIRFKRGRVDEGTQLLKRFVGRMRRVSNGCTSITFGPNTAETYSAKYNFDGCGQGYTHVLACNFKTVRDHERYQTNEVHLSMKDKIVPTIKSVCVLDFTTRGRF